MTTKEFEVQYALGLISYDMREDLALDSATSKRILATLSIDKDDHIRCYVAMNPNTPKRILIKLSTDEDKYVKRHTAANPNTPSKTLNVLLKDERIRDYIEWAKGLRSKEGTVFRLDHC